MFFKVSFRNAKDGQSHTLQANDEHDKRQWISCIKSVLKETGSSSEGEISCLADPEVKSYFLFRLKNLVGIFKSDFKLACSSDYDNLCSITYPYFV